MKRKQITVKRQIQKKIELRNQQIAFLDNKSGQKKSISTMNERDRERIYGNPNRPSAAGINVKLLTNAERTGIRAIPENTDYEPYQKKAFVDYDVVICIPSYDRYKKVKRLISQFYNQQTKYTFKIILLNDGSPSQWYDKLQEDFPQIIYIKNEKPNGKILHWYCYNQMWEYLKDIECHAVLQMDDDFILCDDFLNTIIDLYFEIKEKNNQYMAIAPHLWSFKKEVEREGWWSRKDFVDGIALIDDIVIKNMEYKMKPVDVEEVSKPGIPVRAWTQIYGEVNRMGCWIYRTPNSLVYHDGNSDSKLHPNSRGGNKGVFTQKYIGNL